MKILPWHNHMKNFYLQWVVYILLWQIRDSKIVSLQSSEEFKVHITEKGRKFVEKIQIDGKNGIEYFYVPAHNGRVEADYLYDFKQVI